MKDGDVGRPSCEGFEKRLGRSFRAVSPDGVEEVWVLKRVEVLKAPDWEGLEELECFALSFEREEVRTEVGQGVFRLDDGEGFGEELFVVRGMGSLMEVTVN